MLQKGTKIQRNAITFYILFDCHMTNFGPLLSGQCHSPNINRCVYSSFDPIVAGGLVTTLGP